MSQNHHIARHVARIPRSGIREFFDLVQNQSGVISLGVGEPDFDTPWHIREAAIYALEKGHTSYTANLGQPRLRQAISHYVEDHFSIGYSPAHEILVTVGVSEALDIALRALLNPGDEVLFHEPCYVSYSPSIELAHGIARPLACQASNGFAVTAQAISEAINPKTKVLMLNFPTNPTGGVMQVAELERIAALAREKDLIVITDEIYSELTYEGGHVSIASMPGMKERTLFLHGFSKAFAMTGFRIGYACGPAELIEAMMRIHQYSMLCASSISQAAAVEALENGIPAMNSMRDEYRARRNYIVDAFNKMGLECQLPGGSFYAFPSIQASGLSSRQFARQLLEKEQVACVPGDAFGPSGEGFLRCCFATSLDEIKEATTRMQRFMSGLRNADRQLAG